MPTPHRTPDDGRPSPEACARFAGELHDQLATSHLAWEAALLRSDAALASGDRDEVAAALEDHRSLLAALEDRVSAIVADAAPDPGVVAAPSVRSGPSTPSTGRTARQQPSAWRRGAASLLGAAAAVALTAGFTVGALSELDRAGRTLTGSEPVAADRAQAPGSDGVALQVAGEQVVVATPFVFTDVVGPVRELARFAGTLPAPATAAAEDAPSEDAVPATPGGSDDEELHDAAPDRERLAGDGAATDPLPDDPLVAGPGEEGPASTDAGPPPALEELGTRLADRDPDGGQVTSNVPQPLAELTERIRRSLRAEPTSEPGTALR